MFDKLKSKLKSMHSAKTSAVATESPNHIVGFDDAPQTNRNKSNDDVLPLTEMQKVAEYYRICEQNGIDHVRATAGLGPAMAYAKYVLSDVDE